MKNGEWVIRDHSDTIYPKPNGFMDVAAQSVSCILLH